MTNRHLGNSEKVGDRKNPGTKPTGNTSVYIHYVMCMHTYMFNCICMYWHTYIDTCTHMHAHKYTWIPIYND